MNESEQRWWFCQIWISSGLALSLDPLSNDKLTYAFKGHESTTTRFIIDFAVSTEYGYSTTDVYVRPMGTHGEDLLAEVLKAAKWD